MTAIAIAGSVASGFIYYMQFDGDAAANLLFGLGIDAISALTGGPILVDFVSAHVAGAIVG